MDAINFVLGVRTGQLRGGQLRDLIYAFDDREKEQRGRKAYVMLIYQLMDGTEISFTRSITPAGASEYRIGDLVVNWDDYNNSLKSLGILVKARNFLVFQIHAVDFARKTHDSLEKFTSKTLALSPKKEFDGVYGPAWHCIVGTSFGSFVTRSVGGFMYFSMDNKLHVLLFKTTVHKADDIHFLLIYTKFIYDLLNC